MIAPPREIPPWEAVAGRRMFDLAVPLCASTPHSPVQPPVTLTPLLRHGDRVRPDGGSTAVETIALTGHTGTHVDALCHASQHGRLHGGVAVEQALRDDGVFHSHGVEQITPLLCRGVLLDVARALGRDALAAGHAVTGEQLADCARRQGVELRRGDAVLVRTGRPGGAFADIDEPERSTPAGVPGVDVDGARWLLERGVRVTGSDTLAYEWLAPGAGASELPVHTLLLCQAGVPIVELLALDELADAGVHEFLFVAAPLPLQGATGSPLRPLAVA